MFGRLTSHIGYQVGFIAEQFLGDELVERRLSLLLA